jgi:hypothetical protein
MFGTTSLARNLRVRGAELVYVNADPARMKPVSLPDAPHARSAADERVTPKA